MLLSELLLEVFVNGDLLSGTLGESVVLQGLWIVERVEEEVEYWLLKLLLLSGLNCKAFVLTSGVGGIGAFVEVEFR